MSRRPRLPAIFRLCFVLFCLCGLLLKAPGQTGATPVQISLTASPDPSRYEQNIDLLLMLTVPTPGPAPGGTVSFSIDGVSAGASQPVQNNMAELFLGAPTLSIGSHTVTAVYSGDANYAGATQSTQHTVIKLRSQMGLTVSTPTIYYGQTANAVAQVTPLDSSTDATLNGGTITFLLDGNDICDLAVTGQQETCPSTAGQGIDAGNHVLVAVYSGNQYYEGSRSPDGRFTVLPDDTATALETSLTPSLYGQSVTFTATLTAPYATPFGPVAFYDGVTFIGSGTLNGNGVATVSTSTLTVGTHAITARYAKTLDFNASNGAPIQQIVVLPPPSPVGTTTLVTSSVNPSVVGQSVTFTASVATTGAFVQIPSGTVTFLNGASVLSTASLDKTGSAQLTTSSLAVGQHKITVSYTGNQTFAASTSAVLVQNVVTSLTSAGNGFLLTVTPTTFDVGVGGYVSLSVNVLPLNGFNEAVALSCVHVPAETRCLFDSATVPAGGGTVRLTINPAAPRDCNSDVPYLQSGGRAELLPLLGGLGLLVFRRRRKLWTRTLALIALLGLLPLVSGCGRCTDLGVRPGNYSFSVQGASTGSAAVTHSVAMKMNVHL